jgi:hypothetical protein
MSMPWYRTGKVAITAGQNTVTGTGTQFSANARVGDAFQGPDGRWYEVTNITSATVLSILPAYQGPTVADGSYGLAPMQGYVKESADRLRQIVNDWGSTLAGLGAVSTENVVPVAKGGTGGTTQAQARSGLGLKAAAVADIVGTVSQSGGVPTGAVIERGASANGEFTKYADGTLICRHTMTITDAVNTSFQGGFIGAGQLWTFPHPFVSPPSCPVPSSRASGKLTWCIANGPPTATRQDWYNTSLLSQTSTDYVTSLLAVGRWY